MALELGAPAGASGNVGDWHLDTATGDVREKTAASTWTVRGNIRGPQGAQGPTGSTGSTGPAGPPGPALVVYEQPTAPSSPQPGDVWVDTDAPVPVVTAALTYAQLSAMGAA